MKTLLLVDGSSYLYRAFHALPDLRTAKGEPTGAIRGFVSMLGVLRKLYPAEYLACVFDAPGKTFRDDIYTEYKATRTAMPDDLAAQIAPIHECVRALGWPLLMIEGIEADDVIGTLARHAEGQGVRTVVSTSDKDLAQLVNANVTLVNTMTRDGGKPEVLDEAGVVARFGVRPEQIVDYLTLVGDSVDNVPGVDKVGPKTAVKWLQQYGSLDGIVAHADEIGGKVGENLRAARDWLPTARKLVTVLTDGDVSAHVPQFDALRAGEPDLVTLRDLFTRWEFRAMLREFERVAESAGASPAALPPPVVPEVPPAELDYQTVTTDAQLDTWLARIQAAELTCINATTTSIDPMQAQLVGISLSVAPFQACYIPLAHRYPGAPDHLDREATLARLKGWLESAEHRKLAQHFKFDQHVFANHGIRLAGIAHDTLLQSYVLEAHRNHDTDSLATRHLGRKTLGIEDVCGKGAGQICFDQVELERATRYAAEDVDVTLALHGKLWPQIESDAKLRHVYEAIELPVAEVLFRMERSGVLIDRDKLAHQSRELGARIAELEASAHALAGQPFNLGSPKQIGDILFAKLGLPAVKKTASGAPSTDEEVLEKLAEDYPLPKALLEHRALSKLKSTYCDKLPASIQPATGRVHTCYGQAVAVTGRLSSSEPNLQNIPIRTLEGRRIREAFIAPPGSVIVSADYSQVELRIMAHISGDRGLMQAFACRVDVHRATAAELGSAPATLRTKSVPQRFLRIVPRTAADRVTLG